MFTTRGIITAVLLIGAFSVTSGQEKAPAEQHNPMSPAELHLRTGVVMLAKLYRCLAEVKDSQTAQGAVPSVVQITQDLQTWTQTLHGMKQEAEEQEALEHTYVPVIEKLNSYIEVQGERLSAANYFGSQDLATALTALYVIAQQ